MTEPTTTKPKRPQNTADADRAATVSETPGGEPLATFVVDGDDLRALAGRDDLAAGDDLAFRVTDDGQLDVRALDDPDAPEDAADGVEP